MNVKTGKHALFCVFVYALLWSRLFHALWLLSRDGAASFRFDLWSPGNTVFELVFAPAALLGAGLIFGASHLVLQIRLKPCAIGSFPNWYVAGMVVGCEQAAAIAAIFSGSRSGFLPAVAAMASALVAGRIVSLLYGCAPDALLIRRVRTVLIVVLGGIAGLIVLLIPFCLFGIMLAFGAKRTDKPPVISPDGVYEVVIYDSDTGAVGSSSGIILRPRHTVLGLFAESIATGHYGFPKTARWAGPRQLEISGMYYPHQDEFTCHDVWVKQQREPSSLPQ